MPKQPGLALNEDSSHFFGTRTAEDMTLKGLRTLIDHYAGEQVSHVLLCPNCMRVSYRSKVWDFIGEPSSKANMEVAFASTWVQNAKILDEKGIDPYTVWIDACREKGISPWISMRMNDVHNVGNPESFIHSDFWREHPEYQRNPHGRGSWMDRAFDYGRKEVREYHWLLVEELFERYDFDGFEMDWMRFGFHFKPGFEEEGCEILTEFSARVRALANEWAKKRGHAILLGARVPSRPENARGLGMDGVRWGREGLIDMLVPTPFFSSADFDIPIEQWRELLGAAAKKITLAAGLENGMSSGGPYRRVLTDIESARGFAVSAYHRGADQVYLFNYFDANTDTAVEDDCRTIFNELGQPKSAVAGPRRHVVTFTDILPPGAPKQQALPKDLEEDGWTPCLRMHIGPKPHSGKAVLRIGLAESENVGQAVLATRVNTVLCKPIADHDTPENISDCARLLQFDIPLEALRDGYNVAQLFLNAGGKQKAIWVEMRIDPTG
ncbi:MAG: hypothetical protein KAR11_05285 [Phycisphaerae bacterium]|nr:hypothetical protein [Phycisphaerae bacterium]